MIGSRSSEKTILFAKNTSGGESKGSADALDQLPFDLAEILRLQDSVPKPFARYCD